MKPTSWMVFLALLAPFIVAAACTYFVSVWLGAALALAWAVLVMWHSPDMRP